MFKIQQRAAKNWMEWIVFAAFGFAVYLLNKSIAAYVISAAWNYAVVPYFGVKPVEFLSVLVVVIAFEMIRDLVLGK